MKRLWLTEFSPFRIQRNSSLLIVCSKLGTSIIQCGVDESSNISALVKDVIQDLQRGLEGLI